MSTLVRQSDFEALAWEYFVHAKADGVIHAEVFFDPRECHYGTPKFSAHCVARQRRIRSVGLST